MKLSSLGSLIIILCFVLAASKIEASSYASSVISFSQGVAADPNYDNPSVVLGAPPVQDSFLCPINITYSPWETDEVVSLGNGGSITISFDHPVINNSPNV